MVYFAIYCIQASGTKSSSIIRCVCFSHLVFSLLLIVLPIFSLLCLLNCLEDVIGLSRWAAADGAFSAENVSSSFPSSWLTVFVRHGLPPSFCIHFSLCHTFFLFGVDVLHTLTRKMDKGKKAISLFKVRRYLPAAPSFRSPNTERCIEIQTGPDKAFISVLSLSS